SGGPAREARPPAVPIDPPRARSQGQDGLAAGRLIVAVPAVIALALGRDRLDDDAGALLVVVVVDLHLVAAGLTEGQGEGDLLPGRHVDPAAPARGGAPVDGDPDALVGLAEAVGDHQLHGLTR